MSRNEAVEKGTGSIRQLTQEQVEELRGFKYKQDGDMLYWDKMAEFYSDVPDILERIEFEKGYLESLRAIPYTYASHWKTERMYLDTVDEFNRMVGYEPEDDGEDGDNNGAGSGKGYKDCLLEEIAAKFGIDIDINGDGMTSFEKYRNGKDKGRKGKG